MKETEPVFTPEGANYEAWKIKPLDPEEQSDFRILTHNLVGYAILAATSHNVQGWKFSVSEQERRVGIHVDPERILPESDKKGRQAFIGTGCALANFEVAARHYGLEPQVELLPQEDNPYLAASIDLNQSGEVGDEELFTAIASRRVNRSKYEPKRMVPKEVIEEMKEYVADPDLQLHLIEDKPTRNIIAAIQVQADQFVLNNDAFRHELADWLLPNDTDSSVGMPGHNFGLRDETALRLHKELSVSGRFDHDLARGFAVSDGEGIRSSPIIGVISVTKDDPLHWIKAGYAWQMMALVAEKHGLNMAISAALVEVGTLNKMLMGRLKTLRKRPTMVFRIGYATEERPHSPRRPVKEVIVYEDTFSG